MNTATTRIWEVNISRSMIHTFGLAKPQQLLQLPSSPTCSASIVRLQSSSNHPSAPSCPTSRLGVPRRVTFTQQLSASRHALVPAKHTDMVSTCIAFHPTPTIPKGHSPWASVPCAICGDDAVINVSNYASAQIGAVHGGNSTDKGRHVPL